MSSDYARPKFDSLRAQLVMHVRMERLLGQTTLMQQAVLRDFDFDQQTENPFASGCFIMIRTDFFRRIGKMDEDFPLYAEDHDPCLRIYGAGGRILFFPGATAVHLGAESSKSIGLISHEQMVSNRHRLYRKHFGPFKASAYAAILCMGAVIDLLRFMRNRIGKWKTFDEQIASKTGFTIQWFLGLQRARPLPQRSN